MIREPSVKKIAGVPVTPIFLPKATFLSNGLAQSVFPVGAMANGDVSGPGKITRAIDALLGLAL